MTHGWLYYN